MSTETVIDPHRAMVISANNLVAEIAPLQAAAAGPMELLLREALNDAMALRQRLALLAVFAKEGYK